jgi:hypothetical protein
MEIVIYLYAAILVTSSIVGVYSFWKIYSNEISKLFVRFPFGIISNLGALKSLKQLTAQNQNNLELSRHISILAVVRTINIILITVFVLFASIVLLLSK